MIQVASSGAILHAGPSVMLDPAGHAKNTGCMLHKGYERAETYKCAEVLKSRLEQHNIKTLLTRAPGEVIVHPLQNASFANRVNTNLFIQLHFVKATDRPTVTIHHLMFDPVLDNVQRAKRKLEFTPIHEAHFKNIDKTKNFALNCSKSCKSALTATSWLVGKKPLGIPLKPLTGICCPAIIIEAELTQDDQWQDLIEPLTQAILAQATLAEVQP